MPYQDNNYTAPCQNEDVSGGPIDLWFGEGWGEENRIEAAQHAALLCETVCKIQNPDMFNACRDYFDTYKPSHGVWGGRIADVY